MLFRSLGTVLFNDPGEVSKVADQLFKLESKLKLFEDKLSSLLSTRFTIDSIIGRGQAIQELKDLAVRAMDNDFPVLITGESGTGKELFAQAIHDGSPRRISPFVHFNCAAIPRELFESELFGYEPGAFTGAHPKGKMGKFELADQGTIFFDEIGELPLEMQPKLLRVLETKQFERVGGNSIINSDFRIIAATNRNLEDLMHEGRFRQDLFYRLKVLFIHVPPLRQRPEDIEPLAEHILHQHLKMTPFERICFSPSALDILKSYSWPGNVRELANVLERVLCTLKHETIGSEDLPSELKQGATQLGSTQTSLKNQLCEAEKRAIVDALKVAGQNKTQAAELLGIHRSLLYKKMDKFGMK